MSTIKWQLIAEVFKQISSPGLIYFQSASNSDVKEDAFYLIISYNHIN
jgi:hypothetical protein